MEKKPQGVWAIYISPDWVELRAGTKPPVAVQSRADTTISVNVGWNRPRWVKQPHTIVQNSFVGGRVLGAVKRSEFMVFAIQKRIKYPSHLCPIVQIPDVYASKMRSLKWLRKNIQGLE